MCMKHVSNAFEILCPSNNVTISHVSIEGLIKHVSIEVLVFYTAIDVNLESLSSYSGDAEDNVNRPLLTVTS